MSAITTRVRGFPAWSPQRKTRELRANVRSVLLEYADYLPFTVRQVFYRLARSATIRAGWRATVWTNI